MKRGDTVTHPLGSHLGDVEVIDSRNGQWGELVLGKRLSGPFAGEFVLWIHQPGKGRYGGVTEGPSWTLAYALFDAGRKDNHGRAISDRDV